MRAIGRKVAATVFAGCVALAGPSRGVAETLDEQPIAVPGQEAPVPAESALTVRDVRIDTTDGRRRMILALSREPDGIQNFQLSSPPRLVVDVHGPIAARAREARFAVSDPGVTRVRVAPYEGQLRIVLDLKRRSAVTAVRQEGATLVADLEDAAPAKRASAEPAPAPAPIETAAIDPVSEPVLAPIVDATSEPAAKPAEPEHVPAPAMPVVAADEAPRAHVAPPRRAARIRPAFDEIGENGPTLERVAATELIDEPARGESLARLAPAVRGRDTLAPAPSEPVFTGTKISLDFKDADIQNVLRVLADVSGLNIIATDDVQGKVTLHLSDVPWDQAFDLILRTNRLEKTQEGNVVRVSSVKRLTEERDALKAANESETQLEPLRVKYIRVNYARADEALVDKVKGVLTERGAVTFDDRTNTIIVRDIEDGIGDASHLIKELDVQSPQVLIEANIVEASQDFSRGLGIQWGYRYEAGPATGNPTGHNFPGTVGFGGSGVGAGLPAPAAGTGATPQPVPFLASFPIPNSFGSGFGPGSGSALDLALGSLDGAHSLSARITALENDGKAKVISRPRVITMNNVAATIQSLTIIRVKLPSTGTVISTGGGGAAGANTATEKINTGITLVVTPQVSSDGFVLMNIYAKSSLPDFTRAVDGIPSEISREANSNVLIRNGDTVVLGGIYRHTGDDREDGLPYLSKVPAIGWLFKRTLETKHHEELLVFLTPKVVEAGTASLPPAERLWAERRGG